MEILVIFAFIAIITLLIWNIATHARTTAIEHEKYHELNGKINYLAALGSTLVVIIAYLGWSTSKDIKEFNARQLREFINEQSQKIDSIVRSKNILKAGVYIVNDLDFKAGKEYKFDELRTIDDKPLPKFSFAPKLIVSTATGENLRIITVTPTSFTLGEPITRYNSFVAEEANKNYPKTLKFDVWIADYKTN
jgi:hypothetical protein